MRSRVSAAIAAWDRWFYRLDIDVVTGETIRRDGPAWLLDRVAVRGRLLATDKALYYKSSSSILMRIPQVDLRIPLAEVEAAAVRKRTEWRAALPGLSAFELVTRDNRYVFQAPQSGEWVAVIILGRDESRR